MFQPGDIHAFSDPGLGPCAAFDGRRRRLAHNCPNEMKAIDAKLATSPTLTADNAAKVKQLRADGEMHHKAGKHDDSMKSLADAKKILGI